MRPKLCVTVTAASMAELRSRRDAVIGADLVELRLDTVRDPDVAAALNGRRTPVIVTCRPRREGGFFDGAEEERHAILLAAQRLGAEYIDVEWRAGFTDLLDTHGGRGVVLSMHDFQGVPPDLPSLAHAMHATRAEIIKIAVMAQRLSDTLPLHALPRGDQPRVLIAMGDAGIATRVLPDRFGSCWTYAGNGVAPGQLDPDRMRQELGFGAPPDAEIYGVVGRPVAHSVSPAMHNAAFSKAGVAAVYLPFAAADFEDFLTFAKTFGVKGASVTAPYKRAAFEHAIDADPLAREVGSVNTLRRTPGGWAACNTDVAGFLAPLRRQFAIAGRRATVLGAGGAARAAALALSRAGASVTIVARHADRAADVARLVGGTCAQWPVAPDTWDVLVNATPVGTFPDVEATPVPPRALTGTLVYDLVYNPIETRLLQDARAAGCHTLGGLDMLVAQAQQQFEWWTGHQASGEIMFTAARHALQRYGATTAGVLQ